MEGHFNEKCARSIEEQYRWGLLAREARFPWELAQGRGPGKTSGLFKCMSFHELLSQPFFCSSEIIVPNYLYERIIILIPSLHNLFSFPILTCRYKNERVVLGVKRDLWPIRCLALYLSFSKQDENGRQMTQVWGHYSPIVSPLSHTPQKAWGKYFYVLLCSVLCNTFM